MLAASATNFTSPSRLNTSCGVPSLRFSTSMISQVEAVSLPRVSYGRVTSPILILVSSDPARSHIISPDLVCTSSSSRPAHIHRQDSVQTTSPAMRTNSSLKPRVASEIIEVEKAFLYICFIVAFIALIIAMWFLTCCIVSYGVTSSPSRHDRKGL